MANTEIKRVITIESKESLNTLNNLNSRIKELKGTMGDLGITTEAYRETSEEVNRLENVKRNAIRGVTAAVEGSYNAYSKELSILQKHRKTLSENTQEYREITKRVGELQDKLKAMDAEVGTFSRNVGNYSSAFDGLQGSVNGVVAKLPSLNGGLASFAQSLNESLPNLIKSVESYKEMAAEAGSSVSAIAALSKAMFSWNALISIAVTLVVAFGDKISSWVKELFNAEKRLTSAQKAIKEFNEAVKEDGLGIGENIVKIKQLQSAWNALGKDLDAKKRFVEENKQAFDDLGLSIDDVASAERFLIDQADDYVKSMRKRALAVAAYRQAGEYYDKAASLQALNMIDKGKYEAMPDSIYSPLRSVMSTLEGGTTNVYKTNTDKTKLGEQMAARDKEIAQYNEMGDALFKLASSYNVAAEAKGGFNGGGGGGGSRSTSSKYSAPGYSSSTASKMAIPTLGAVTSGIDEAAEMEALKATLAAKRQMLYASAEEQVAIEEKLSVDLATIEETRLALQEVALNEMLRNEELSAEERMAIEEELTRNKLAQTELQLKAEEKRAEEEKAILDKADKEKRAREKSYVQFSMAMAQTTSQILNVVADEMKEQSKEQKALRAAAIVMDTFSAAMAGWNSAQSLPTPANLILGAVNVAASVAMGAVQLKNLLAVAEDGSNAASAMSSAQSAPAVSSSMPAAYTRNLQGDNELEEMNKDTRVYVVESDITEAQEASKVRVESASF